MTRVPRRQGYLSTTLVEVRDELRRLKPRKAPGIMTSLTTRGVVRKPIQRRAQATGGGGAARWA